MGSADCSITHAGPQSIRTIWLRWTAGADRPYEQVDSNLNVWTSRRAL